ncbi:MAG: alkaline phosphatase family protein [Pseudomonadota bacterium]|nr:alkaline phosphatase family protein [Pseudomonadota bacterium]
MRRSVVRRDVRPLPVGIVAGALALALGGCPGTPPSLAGPGVFVLGVDGMDPTILARMMGEGRMPNFAKLAQAGAFQPLGTSNPPQSPVAWSNFVTGLDPGGHGIYDFVHRDPETYLPISSATPPPGDAGTSLDLFGFYLPIGGGDDIVNNRTGTPWWDALHDAGVDVEVYRVPGNYPPTPSDAKVLAGMGTVDMRGGYGQYTWYTDQAVESRAHLKGDIQLVTVEDYDLDGVADTVKSTLKGPPDLFHLPPGQIPGDSDYLTVPVTVSIDPDEEVALIRAGSAQAIVREGEWTDWMDVSFDALPAGAMPLAGAVRFYAKELRPAFRLYASPVNLSAESPPQDISTPSDFASDLADVLGGQYYTQGMPEETNALKDTTFSDDDYVKQVALVQEDAEAMLDVALARFRPGDATFFYLSDIDLQCHMLWRHGDPRLAPSERAGAPAHPAYEAEAAAHHADDIEGYYENVDRLLGEVVAGLPTDTFLVVMSDHGFQPFTRTMNLNGWLRDNGWLTLKDGKHEGHIAQGDVDWSKTRAYGLGFNALYLNLQGREAEGIVAPGDVPAIEAQLREQLVALVDPTNSAHPVLRVDRGADIYHGARVAEAPDLVVGYDRGYGNSDESTLGEILPDILADNTSRWSGNHLMAPEVVPGVLLTNRPISGEGHDLTDITATLLAWYGVAPLPGMTGQPVLTR